MHGVEFPMPSVGQLAVLAMIFLMLLIILISEVYELR